MKPSNAMLIQHLAASFGLPDIMNVLEPLGFRAIVGGENTRPGFTVLILCPDASIFLGVAEPDPSDDTQDRWHTAGFPDISTFEQFLQGSIPQILDLRDSMDQELLLDISSAMEKFILATSLEAGHA